MGFVQHCRNNYVDIGHYIFRRRSNVVCGNIIVLNLQDRNYRYHRWQETLRKHKHVVISRLSVLFTCMCLLYLCILL